MTWTTPRTWGVEIVTAALMNTHVRDNLNYLKTDRTMSMWLDAEQWDSDGAKVTRETAPNTYRAVSFDPTTIERARCAGIAVPHFKATSAYALYLFWSVAAASGNVFWTVRYLNVADTESLVGAKSTIHAAAVAVPGIDVLDRLWVGNVGGAALDDLLSLNVERMATDAADTNTGDALMLGMQIQETEEV